jgi:hypothetical protein
MERMILGGWLPDPPQASDKSFEAVLPRMRPVATGDFHMLRTPTPVSQQGKLKSCAANVVADALEILMGQKGEVTQVSRLFLYYNARNYHNATDRDAGTYLRMAFEAIRRLGVCTEETWPYIEANVLHRPSVRAYHEANDYKVSDFYRITSTGRPRVDAVEAAIKSNHPVVFGSQVGPELMTYNGKSDAAFACPKEMAGRHAMLWCGFRVRDGKREFMMRNSWGDKWGLGGHAWMSEDYVSWDQTMDIWVPTMMPSL